MSLLGKIKHFIDPGYFEPEKPEKEEKNELDVEESLGMDDAGHTIVAAPQCSGPLPEPKPGSVDANCIDSPYVILHDALGASALLSEMLDEKEIRYQIIEHHPSVYFKTEGDFYFDRVYVEEARLEEALQILDVFLAESEKDLDEITFADENGKEFTLADVEVDPNANAEYADDPIPGHYQDGEDTYLIGTDFVLIRHYGFDQENEFNRLVRCYKEEGITFTATTADDEPESAPFEGWRVYATSDFKKKARRLADALETPADSEAEEDSPEEADYEDTDN